MGIAGRPYNSVSTTVLHCDEDQYDLFTMAVMPEKTTHDLCKQSTIDTKLFPEGGRSLRLERFVEELVLNKMAANNIISLIGNSFLMILHSSSNSNINST